MTVQTDPSFSILTAMVGPFRGYPFDSTASQGSPGERFCWNSGFTATTNCREHCDAIASGFDRNTRGSRGKRALVGDAAWATLAGALYGGVVLVGFAVQLGAPPASPDS
jgi:hypothetical protein